MGFIEELKWRGMIHDIMPGTEELFKKERVTAYIGFDPTADSLHIGHLVQVMMLRLLQVAGHKPIVLLGGATGMIGDPSGKSEERNLLDEKTLKHNQECIKKQMSKLLDFDSSKETCAIMVNNYDWMKGFSFLQFIRDIGKHLTVSYMMAKDSVKKRLETGLSFTEFSYQLVQGYDFLYLYQNNNCKLQMGGSDQWGNITAGTELIRRISSGLAYAMTCPLITKSDGGKFGKTESGNVWLDPNLTTPYKFYQFWLNTSDEDSVRYLKIFTLLSKDKIGSLEKEHIETPHLRVLQKKLAKELTCLIHTEDDYNNAVEASEILFGKGTKELIEKIDEKTFLSVFEGVPHFEIIRKILNDGDNILDFLAINTNVFSSKGKARRMIISGGLSLNKEKVTDPDYVVSGTQLINNKYVLVQKGKKNYYLITVK